MENNDALVTGELKFESQYVSVKGCEVCYRFWPSGVIIGVGDIAFQDWKRVTPWYVCPECAEKIYYAVTQRKRGGQRGNGISVVGDRQWYQ
jgi:hypothetical protein